MGSSMTSSPSSSLRGTQRKGGFNGTRKQAGRHPSTSTLGESMGSSSRLSASASLPDILNGDLAYPPTPVFLRNFLSRTYDWTRDRRLQEQQMQEMLAQDKRGRQQEGHE